jgi:hypothetical protein
MERAKLDAVHAVLFKGIPGSNLEEPLVDTEGMLKHKEYFNNFFGTDEWLTELEDIKVKKTIGAPYLNYVNLSTDGSVSSNDVVKVGKKYKVGVAVAIAHARLREQLEKDNIIEEFAAAVAIQRPSIMVVPADDWCNKNGYMTEFENSFGQTTKVPDYQKALQENSELRLAISKIAEMFAERGFPLKDLKATLDKIAKDQMRMSVQTSRESFAGIKQSPVDMLNQTAQADILLKVGWIVNKNGPRQSITFRIDAIDPYTSEQITGASGTGPELVSNDIPILLEEAVVSHLDNLQDDMQDYFEDIRENGRKISVKVMIWENAGFDLESYCEGDIYIDLIYDWMLENTVNGAFTEASATQNMINYERVRIPLEDKRGRKYNARQFGRELRGYLESTCGLKRQVKSDNKGLGEVWIILGAQ